jgi:hypothetical protein
MRRRALALLALAVILSGCRTSAEVAFDPAAPSRPRTVVVLFFEEAGATDQAVDRAILGHTSEAGAGKVVSKLFAQALAEEDACQVLRGTSLLAACLKARVDVRYLNKLTVEDVAAKLGVDAVIKGKVSRFRQSWFLFLSRAGVEFTAACHVPGRGEPVWQAKGCGARMQAGEADLALEASREIARLVRQKAGKTEGAASTAAAP